MGTYCTTTGLQVNMIGTKFDSATTAMAGKMITKAENEINKYLSKRYDLGSSSFQTTTSIPPLVSSLCEDLAEGYMHQRMSRGGKEALARAKSYITPAIENLTLISEYKGDLFDTAGSIIVDKSDASYRVLDNTSEFSQTFNEDSPLKWRVDSDKLDSIKTDRSG